MSAERLIYYPLHVKICINIIKYIRNQIRLTKYKILTDYITEYLRDGRGV